MKNEKGFTLIEMMIVIAIVSILAAVVIPAFKAAQEEKQITNEQPLTDDNEPDILGTH